MDLCLEDLGKLQLVTEVHAEIKDALQYIRNHDKLLDSFRYAHVT
jgi:hypothetical protein